MTGKKGRPNSVMPEVKVGDVDVMSRAARRANLPLCDEPDNFTVLPLVCTRAKGHADSKDGPAALHVATVPGDVAVAVWH